MPARPPRLPSIPEGPTTLARPPRLSSIPEGPTTLARPPRLSSIPSPRASGERVRERGLRRSCEFPLAAVALTFFAFALTPSLALAQKKTTKPATTTTPKATTPTPDPKPGSATAGAKAPPPPKPPPTASTATLPTSDEKAAAGGKPEAEPNVKVERGAGGKKVYRITSEITITGKIQKPEAFYVLQKSGINYEWTELKQDFLPKIVDSVAKAPF